MFPIAVQLKMHKLACGNTTGAMWDSQHRLTRAVNIDFHLMHSHASWWESPRAGAANHLALVPDVVAFELLGPPVGGVRLGDTTHLRQLEAASNYIRARGSEKRLITARGDAKLS